MSVPMSLVSLAADEAREKGYCRQTFVDACLSKYACNPEMTESEAVADASAFWADARSRGCYC